MLYFENEIRGEWVVQICLRQSSSASAALSWLQKDYGIIVPCLYGGGWYKMTFACPDEELRRMLRERASREDEGQLIPPF